MKDIIFLGLLVLGGFWFFNFLKTNPDFFPYLNVSKIQNIKVDDLKKINNLNLVNMSIPTIESFDIFNQDVVATGIQGQVQNQNQIQNQNQVQNYSLVPFSSDQDFFRNLIHSYDLDIQNLEQSVINLQNVNLRDILNEKIILKKNELNSLKEKYRQIFNQDYNY